jgi:hypothetical protein
MTARSRLAVLASLIGVLTAGVACGDPVGPNDLEVVTPESVGSSSADLGVAKAYFDSIGSAAFMALYVAGVPGEAG